MWSYLRNFVKYFAEYKFHNGDILNFKNILLWIQEKRNQVIWLLADIQEVLLQHIPAFYL